MSEDGLRIGVFVCECGLNIAGSVDCEAMRAYKKALATERGVPEEQVAWREVCAACGITNEHHQG